MTFVDSGSEDMSTHVAPPAKKWVHPVHSPATRDYISALLAHVKAKNPAEPEFHQAVQEVAESVGLVLEFAADISGPPGEPREFAFLQLRPLTPAREQELVDVNGIAGDTLLARSQSVLGNGRITGIRDVVLVEPGYRGTSAAETCTRLARLNADLLRRGEPYILIGPGRWGSTHLQLGIPVAWEDIAGARVIVETSLSDGAIAPSQGSHFFQNLASSDTGYFTIDSSTGREFLDWEWLLAQPAEAASGVRHLRLSRPILVVINGTAREGVIAKP
jgi:hypothetical protein